MKQENISIIKGVYYYLHTYCFNDFVHLAADFVEDEIGKLKLTCTSKTQNLIAANIYGFTVSKTAGCPHLLVLRHFY